LHTSWQHIIQGCLKNDLKAQGQLYRGLYPAMIKVCLRYANGNADDAGLIYNQAMLKVFKNLEQYSEKGIFEAWVRRIIVNTCIDHCRSKLKFQVIEINEATADVFPIVPDVYNRITGNEIVSLLYELPENIRIVFNLYVLEGYKHSEIGAALKIPEGTCRWYLSEARKILKEKIETRFKKEFLKYAI
jgi:RNA polymerase sigma-70 factor (ECF subfamily)